MDASTLPTGTVPVLRLPLTAIGPDPRQPRRHFDDAALAELTDSIRAHGVIQPIVVSAWVAREDDPPDLLTPDFRIISGERRWRASALAGKADILAVVRDDLSEDDIAVLQLVENLQRADLTLAETALGCQRLVEAVGLERAAAELGMSKPWVSQRARLLELDPAIVELIESGHLTSPDMAHDINMLASMDEEGAEEAERFLRGIAEGAPPPRHLVREALAEAREYAERARQQEAAASQRRVEAAADGGLFSAPDDEDDDRQPGDATPRTTAKPARTESQYERERRLREEAWAALMPECRKLQREARKAILAGLEQAGVKPSKEFELTISAPQTVEDAPAKATGAKYHFEVRGGTDDAGLVLEALAPKFAVDLNTRVTIPELRQIEALLGKQFPVRAHGYDIHSGHPAVSLRGSQVAQAGALIFAAHTARQPEQPAYGGLVGAVGSFLLACTQRDAKARVKAADLHAAYVAWCERHSVVPIAITDNNWGETIAEAGIEKKRSDGWRYVGIKLLVEAE